MRDATQGWIDETIAGFRAMGSSSYASAAAHWLTAHDALGPAAPSDPRLAASQTNAGAAHVLLGQMRRGETALAVAEKNWTCVLRSVETWDIPVRGPSSSFHFILASRHLDAFRNAQRARYLRQGEAGLAIARFNRLLTSAHSGSIGDALLERVASTLSDLLGPLSPEVRLLQDALLPSSETIARDSHYADKVVEFDLRYTPMPQASNEDWQHLEPAVALTALLRPGLPLGPARPDEAMASLRSLSAVKPSKRVTT